MQGTFQQVHPSQAGATGTNWGGILNPGPDEEAIADQHRRENDAELHRIREVRQAAAAGVAPPPYRPARVPIPIPPSSRFQLKTKWFYIVQDPPTLPFRPGLWGHYLVTYEEHIVNGHRLAKPYMENPLRIRHPDDITDGAPGTEEGDPKPMPDPYFCLENVHYVSASAPDEPPAYYEIGVETLRATLEQAEALDLAFARRMEGMGNVTRSVVWDCLDPDYDPGDRKAVMDQFTHKYMERFYARLEPGNTPDVRDVAEEALHKHKTFCKAWTQKHYKTLTPTVTAPAETLAAEFFPFLEPWFPKEHPFTRAELARILMRHEEFSTDFATCLHYYMVSLEQSRGGRNASYKQMTQVSNARAWSYSRMGNMLAEKQTVLMRFFRELRDPANYWFHPTIVDWYCIMGQIPQVHKYFDDEAAQSGPAPRIRNGGIVPPWRFAR